MLNRDFDQRFKVLTGQVSFPIPEAQQKEQNFAEEKNQNPRINTEDTLQRYIFTYLHKIFFAEFLIIFYEWVSRIVERKNYFKGDQPTSQNSISKIFDYWFDSILGGYITEFLVDTVKSYSAAEREFFQGPRGKFLNSLRLWTKMLLCEKGMLRMELEL